VPRVSQRASREYYGRNAEPIRERQREYRGRNAEAEREWQHRYRETPEGRAADARQRARRRARLAATEAALTAAEWAAILERHDWRCYVCAAPFDHLEHVVPLASGGMHTAGNVRPACAPCNTSKGAAALEEWLPRRLEVLVGYGVTSPEAVARVVAGVGS
jgi:5-methylcytosine-specific restriction endonuclease McrA